MGLSKGSIGYIRFGAMGAIPEAFEQVYTDALIENEFRDLVAQSDEEVVHGWVRHDDPLSTRFLAHELVRPGPVIVVCLRIDTLKVSAAMVRAHVQHKCKVALAGSGRAKLTRAEIEQVRSDVRSDLRGQSLPKMQVIDAAWNLGTGELRLITTSARSAGFFVERFENTFGLKLVELGPRGVLEIRGFSDDKLDRLARLEPERFHLHVNAPRGAATDDVPAGDDGEPVAEASPIAAQQDGEGA